MSNYIYKWSNSGSESDWQYANINVPQDVAWMMSGSDVQEVLKAIIGHGCEVVGPDYDSDADVCCPAIGRSAYGYWIEGDIDYEEGGMRYSLAYDFIDLDESTSRIFRYAIDPQPYK